MSDLLTSKAEFLPALKSIASSYPFFNDTGDDFKFIYSNPVPGVFADLLMEILNEHGFLDCNLFKNKREQIDKYRDDYINNRLDPDSKILLSDFYYVSPTKEGFVIEIDNKFYTLQRIKRYFPGFSKVAKEFRIRYKDALAGYLINNSKNNLKYLKGRNVIGKVIKKIDNEYLVQIIGHYFIDNAKCYYDKAKRYFYDEYSVIAYLPFSNADRNFEYDCGAEYEFNLEKVIIEEKDVRPILSRVNKNFIKCVLEKELQTYVKVLSMGVSEKRNCGPVKYIVVRSTIKPDIEAQKNIKYILGMDEGDVIDYKLFPVQAEKYSVWDT
ncbi:MAG: hypothetical protein EVG15_09725 [Candidatus Acididesulfobacter diazotrophicus]|jgi:hypothetical protein|uniref:Uncharacterized protein n=1 Tax=Candidatus Acididesulfobacter diazotrophicus TaxID=2597226 RepID=A0A519BK96_9DELT|nr:MAG: hypothetical protein EVG15_09725 [Candidatus Acididesulfobacter diazotrophicus]